MSPPEEGSAIVLAVLLLAIAALLMSAIVMTAIGSLSTARRHANRTVGLAPADSAITSYQQALRQRATDESSGYRVDRRVMERIADPGDVVLSNEADVRRLFPKSDLWAVDPSMGPPGQQVTLREPMGDGRSGYWQVYKLESPDSSLISARRNLVAYFRAWVAGDDGADATEPRVIRVEYRPGLFSDYELISDGPIRLFDGARVDGPVHSNGLENPKIPVPSGYGIWSSGSISCSAAASFSTARGAISVPCGEREPDTDVHINFLQVEESFQRIRGACNDGRVLCSFPPPANGIAYDVQLDGASAVVDGVSVALPSIAVMLFEGDVELRGTTTRRLTIAAVEPEQRGGAANVRILGDVGTPITGDGDAVIAADPTISLGILAQGDVIVGTPSADCAVTLVHAAIVSETGGLTIDPRWTTQVYQENPPFCDTGQVTIFGSVAAHRSPTMRWTWDSLDASAGYASRRYVWDEALPQAPPPYLPLTHLWSVVDWTDANEDCLTTRQEDSLCR